MRNVAIRMESVSKHYKIYSRDVDRVREILSGRSRHQLQAALEDVTLQVEEGEVVGVIGRNGAGKSTLLKLLAGTLQPSSGSIAVQGRIAALLELGASFHPEMSGHENIYLYCSILGLSRSETDAVYDSIVEFSGLQDYIQRPVKTYSSGMFVRLAFAAATHVNPDILIVDEALSVGDGIFSRRSFDRIMRFKESGKTIFFCSHSLYQVEALCDRVIWIDDGRVQRDGNPSQVISAYSAFLNRLGSGAGQQADSDSGGAQSEVNDELPRIVEVTVAVGGEVGRSHKLESGSADLAIDIRYSPGRDLPLPSVGIVILDGNGRPVSSAGTVNDGIVMELDDQGMGRARLCFPALPLLKGYYVIDAYLLCEKGLHIYERVKQVAELEIFQQGLERGIVKLPHRWD